MITFALLDDDLQPKERNRWGGPAASIAAVVLATACTLSLSLLGFYEGAEPPPPELELRDRMVVRATLTLFAASCIATFASPLTRSLILSLRILSAVLIPACVVFGEIFVTIAIMIATLPHH